VRTVIHRKALEKTSFEDENGLARIAKALKYFCGGPKSNQTIDKPVPVVAAKVREKIKTLAIL
jgi:hypothetical protein